MQHSTSAPRRALLGVVACAALLALALAPAALAQAWPSKPIRLVVIAPAGGSSDIVARTLADGLTPLLGQTVIVDDKADGLGAIGTQDLLSCFKELGTEVGQPLTPEQLSQSLRVASEKHGTNLKAIGFKPD